MNLEERIRLLEEIVLEIGDELRARCDYRWFSLGEKLESLEKLRSDDPATPAEKGEA